MSDRCPLAPAYVSAVDCGNLLAALLLVSTASAENAEHARGIMRDMDMSFMFDEERGLLRIGYDTRTHKPDGGHYDLLGSEAALTYLTCIGLRQAAARVLSRAFRAGVARGQGSAGELDGRRVRVYAHAHVLPSAAQIADGRKHGARRTCAHTPCPRSSIGHNGSERVALRAS